jgi:hypothetical protein
MRGVVEVIEAHAHGEFGGLQAPLRGALATVIGLRLQQRVEELGIAHLIAGSVGDGLVEGIEHAEQLHLGHQVAGHRGTHSRDSWLGATGSGSVAQGVSGRK